MKKNYLLIAGLVVGLSGTGAMAQTSRTPGVPAPNDHNYPYAQADQGNQSNADQNTYSDQQDQQDQQQYPQATRHHDRDGNTNYNADQNGQNTDRDRQSSSDQNSQYNQNGQYNNGQYNSQRDRQSESSQGWRNDRDRRDPNNRQQNDQNWQNENSNNRNWQNRNPQANNQYDHDRDRSNQGYIGGNEDNGVGYGSQIQSRLQHRSLNNVSVNDTGSRIVLNGTVNSQSQRREAVSIAQAYSHGREVVDRLQVNDNGYQH